MRKLLRMKYMVILSFLLGFYPSAGQDVSFSQFFSNPLYLNPAFAGSVGVPRISLQYRNQWHVFNNAFNTYSVAFDMPVEKLQGGLGFYVLKDGQANNLLNSYQFNFTYSVYVRVSEFYQLHGGIQTGIFRNELRTDQLIFPDNFDPETGQTGLSEELQYLGDRSFSFPDFSAGVMLYSDRIFYGLAVHHIAEPQQSFFIDNDDFAKLERKYSAHVGARLPVFLYGHQRKKFDIAPQLVVQMQGDFNQINYGFFATKNGLTAGTWFRQNIGLQYDAVIFLVGFAKNNWQLTYSYDLTVSGLWGNSGGTSEISLAFLLKNRDKERHLPFFNSIGE